MSIFNPRSWFNSEVNLSDIYVSEYDDLTRLAAGVTPAHKTGRATSYTAQGINPPDVSPESGSSQPQRILELVPELVSPATRRQVYNQMGTDAGVDVSLRAIKTPILGSTFYVEAASADPQDQLIADFVEDNLICGMSAPFINSLEDIVRFFEDGFAVLEKVYEPRSWSQNSSGANSRNYTMLKKLGVRPESSIGSIDYDDNGGPLQINHVAVRADKSTENVVIPIGKALIFTFNRRGGDVTGKSVLRTAYAHWFYKTHLYKIDAIQKERHAIGVPKGKLLPGFKKSDVDAMRQMLRNIRTNEEAYTLLTPTVDWEFAKMEGQLVDVLASVQHHNFMIMMNVMAQFLDSVGSQARANAATQVDMFMKALRYVANYIADVINMYLIPELVIWNFPTTNFPKLCVKNIGETKDIQALGAAYSNMVTSGALTMDIDLENFFRDVIDAPEKDPTTVTPDTYTTKPADGSTSSTNGSTKGTVRPGGNGNGSGNKGVSPNGGAQTENLNFDEILETLD